MYNLGKAKVFTTTTHKIACGKSTAGEWLDLSEFSDFEEFETACKRLHADEKAPEIAFTDWENIPDTLIREHSLYRGIFELIAEVSDWDETRAEALYYYLNNEYIKDESPDSAITDFETHYIGLFADDTEFGREIAGFFLTIPDGIEPYFDYARPIAGICFFPVSTN